MSCMVVLTSRGTTDSLSGSVVEEVAEITGTDPADLDPLYEVVDTEALDSLFHPDRSVGGRVSFEYCDCRVTVTEAGRVSVEQ